MLGEMLINVEKKAPLIHNITNYVTANDCANILLACGASPIMSDEPEEVEEITAKCNGLNLNLGTISKDKIIAMQRAGKKANQLFHPVLLDPVGVGASSLRKSTASKLLHQIQFQAICGNISEIKTLVTGEMYQHGVDAKTSDEQEDIETTITLAKRFSKDTHAVVIISGTTDFICCQNTVYKVTNGHPMMSRITGFGCMLSAMLTAYLAANQEDLCTAALAAVCAMGVCGEIAYQNLKESEGVGSYRVRFLDAVSNLTADDLKRGAKYEII